jgi:pimeloyl-ACP methyl ester carboxylesterase
LRSLNVTGPLVLVGHSLGGIYLRTYAASHMAQVAGMVLVDSSHETQLPVLREQYTAKDKVLVALTVPQLILRSRQWRGGADRRSAVREYRMFKRLGAADRALTQGGLGDRPLIVLTRGPGTNGQPSRLWRAWRDLQGDLALLSGNSRHLISDSPDHYLNEGDPKLLVSAIAEVVRSVRTGEPLQEPVLASDGE